MGRKVIDSRIKLTIFRPPWIGFLLIPTGSAFQGENYQQVQAALQMRHLQNFPHPIVKPPIDIQVQMTSIAVFSNMKSKIVHRMKQHQEYAFQEVEKARFVVGRKNP